MMIIMTITVYDDQGELVRAILFPPPLDFAFYSDFLKSVRYPNSWTILITRMILVIVIVTRLVIN